MKFLKRLFKSKKYVNLKLEIEEGQYHEELVDISKVNERVEELQNHYFPRKDPDKV
ncbi:hypothetical protein GCM10009122_43750 [Fulvivirga kasyanovii]|uniref:hypothetical protein n=1 Tax=Fulvivirga kasyanovii TaxID=396812 RepID=UPI0012BB5CCB|nr:hypothetical protein [Fulvivirga kasyanovii]